MPCQRKTLYLLIFFITLQPHHIITNPPNKNLATSIYHALATLTESSQTLTTLIISYLFHSHAQNLPAIINNPYKNTQATVRIGNSISPEEQAYLVQREPKVRTALEALTNRKLTNKKIPTIAIICSGGGYRSMLCSTGFLSGAETIGLLDSITYLCSLSGSTWAIAPWYSANAPLQKFKNYIIKCSNDPLLEATPQEEDLISQALAVKKQYKQSLTLADPYGSLFANVLLQYNNNKRHITYLSEQTTRIKEAAFPYPLYCAIDGHEDAGEYPDWFTFSPYEIGNLFTGTYIPSWALGRTFSQGISTNNAPEQSLGYLMAIWGAAFAANIHEVLESGEASNNATLINIVKDILAPIEDKRVLPFWGKISNYDHQEGKKQHKSLRLVDAGLDINVPYPPISGLCPERIADIIICMDASAGTIGNTLKKCKEFAQHHHLPFPPISYNNIDKKTISIFNDTTSPTTPTIIYMPCISDHELWEKHKIASDFASYNLNTFDLKKETDEGFCRTSNFWYKKKNAQLVMHQMEFNIRINKQIIIETINEKIDQLNK